jgi:redox-sensitive bicupin YhaK (pirin superfamily)
VLGPNEIQMMSAGSGVVHSEFNASESEPVHLFQIWILPDAEDLQPSYQQVAFAPQEKRGRLRLLAAPEANTDKAMTVIRQDARIYAAEIAVDDVLKQPLEPGRHAWVQVVNGNVSVNGHSLAVGDGVAVSEQRELSLAGTKPAGGEILVFDLP